MSGEIGGAELPGALSAHCAGRLASYERPGGTTSSMQSPAMRWARCNKTSS